MNRFRKNVLALGVSAAAGALIAGLLVPVAATAAPRVSIEVLSGRADSVTGGDALIAVAGAKADDRVFAAGVEVTDAFQLLDGARVGLVDGLPIGVSEIQVVRKHGGKVQASIEIENHPVTGPVFSGPQHPMYCTASAAPWNLGAVDEDCHVATPVVTYRYRTTAGQFADYPVDGSTPGNLATTTVDGATVPYIVRVERGTINRAVYETAVLHAPGDVLDRLPLGRTRRPAPHQPEPRHRAPHRRPGHRSTSRIQPHALARTAQDHRVGQEHLAPTVPDHRAPPAPGTARQRVRLHQRPRQLALVQRCHPPRPTPRRRRQL